MGDSAQEASGKVVKAAVKPVSMTDDDADEAFPDYDGTTQAQA
jgi:hypothetical protein